MSSISSSTRTPSFTLSLQALLTFPIRICNPPPAASSVRSCKITPLIKVSLDDVLNKRHLPPLTLKDFEEWLVFVEGKVQYLYFLLWLKEYEARYATWLAEFGFSYYPTTRLSSSKSNSSLKTTTDATGLGSTAGSDSPQGQNHAQGLAVPTAANINYIPPSPSLALFFTRAKKTFLDPTASPASPYTLPYSALSTLIPQSSSTPASTHSFSASIPQFNTASRPDLVDINEKWKHASRALFGPDCHPHPHPKEFAALANHIRGVLKDSLERFAVSACHNVGTRRAWCGLAGGTVIVLLLGILPTLIAFFYGHSRWIRLVGFLGCWLGGTVIFSSLHGICMMIYLFGDLRQLRSFELVKPAISNPRAIARARPRLRSFFTKTGEEEKPSVKENNNNNNKPSPAKNHHHPNGVETPQRKADQRHNKDDINHDKDVPDNRQPVVVPPASSLPAGNNGPSSPSSALVLPVTAATDAPVVKLGFSVGNKGGEGELAAGKEGDKPTGGDHKLPLQLSTILSTPEDALSPIAESALSISASVSPASSVGDFKEKKSHLDVPNSTSIQPNASATTDLADSESDESDSSSDHGIVISPAFQTSMNYEHQDEWMWESRGGGGGGGGGWKTSDNGEKGKSQRETWTTSRNTSASSPGSRVMSAFSSVIQWATFGVSSTTGVGVRSSGNKDKVDTAVSVSVAMQDDEKAQLSSSVSPTSATILDAADSTTSDPTTPRPTNHAGTFGVRSWIGGGATVHQDDNQHISHSNKRSSARSSASMTRPSSWDHHRRVSSSRGSRWSRGFGFNFGLARGVHSVPEEGVYEGDYDDVDTERQFGRSLVPSSIHARTCPPAEGYYCGETMMNENETMTYEEEDGTTTTCHARSTSQAQTIESFYAPPPRDRASIFGTGALVHHHHRRHTSNAAASTEGTIPEDQCTASFIPREYAAEVLPDLESVPRVSLSMSRASGERDVVVNGEDSPVHPDSNPTPSSTKVSPRIPPRPPMFDFRGLPGMHFDDEQLGQDGDDEDANKENIPLEPTPLRPARPRPPRLNLHTSASVAAPSSTPIGASRAIPPISPALPSSQFTHSVNPDYHHASAAAIANANSMSSLSSPSSSVPLPLPLKAQNSSKFWFDTCPRHPAVEAKIAEAAALEEQKKRNAALLPPPTPRSLVSFWSSSASASAPSTFHSISKGLLPKEGNGVGDGATYPYPHASPAWTFRMRNRIRNFTRSGTPLLTSSIPPIVPAPSTRPSSAQLSSNFLLSEDSSSSGDERWRSRLKSVMSVPAFGPLTRVLSPLVSRGQWEIVIRSAMYSFLSVWIWLGVIVSLPVLHVR